MRHFGQRITDGKRTHRVVMFDEASEITPEMFASLLADDKRSGRNELPALAPIYVSPNMLAAVEEAYPVLAKHLKAYEPIPVEDDGVTHEPIPVEDDVVKRSSPEMTSLAARYMGMDDATMQEQFDEAPSLAQFCADVRSLAASVLSQAEPDDAA